jgi:hypothetical protein
LIYFLLAELGIGGHETDRTGFFKNFFLVKAFAIVMDFNDEVITPVKRDELDVALSVLSNGFAFFARLDPMVDRVTNEMNERIRKDVKDSFVDLCLFARYAASFEK